MSADRYTIQNNDAIHFVTFTIVVWLDLFSRPAYKHIIIDSLNHCIKERGLVIYGWVIMTSHIHLLITSQNGESLSDIIRDFKKFTSKKLIQTAKAIGESRREWLLNRFEYEASTKHSYKVWQDGYYGIECDGTIIEAQDKLDYIHRNPVVEMIVHEPEDYVCSSAPTYANGECLVNIERL